MSSPDNLPIISTLASVLRERGATVTPHRDWLVADNLFAKGDRSTFQLDPKNLNVTLRYLKHHWSVPAAGRHEYMEFVRLWCKHDRQFKPGITWFLAVDATFYVTSEIGHDGWVGLLTTFDAKLGSLLRDIVRVAELRVSPGAAAAYSHELMKAPLAYDFRRTKNHADDEFTRTAHLIKHPDIGAERGGSNA